MERVSHRRGGTIQAMLAACSAVLAVLAAVWPQWIEALGVDPDQGSGFLEWAIPVALAVIAALLFVAARHSRQTQRALGQRG
jgi:hypothetical protein